MWNWKLILGLCAVTAAAFLGLLYLLHNVFFAVGIVLAVGGFLAYAEAKHSPGAIPAGIPLRERLGLWWLALRLTVQDIAIWFAGMRDRVLAWRGGEPAQAVTAPAPPRPPAPQRPAGAARRNDGVIDGVIDGPVMVDVTPAEVPAVFSPVVAHITEFEAVEDADLMIFTRGLAAGDLAMAEALQAQLEHCLTEIGLDPVSVQGLADYAEQKAEHAEGAMRIYLQFAAVYQAVQDFIANGGKLPKSGDFLTGEV